MYNIDDDVISNQPGQSFGNSNNYQMYNTDELKNCIWDFLNAGTETSSTTLKWAVLYLTLHQVGAFKWTMSISCRFIISF